MDANIRMKNFKVICVQCEDDNIKVIDEDEEMDTITLKCKSCGNVEVLK